MNCRISPGNWGHNWKCGGQHCRKKIFVNSFQWAVFSLHGLVGNCFLSEDTWTRVSHHSSNIRKYWPSNECPHFRLQDLGCLLRVCWSLHLSLRLVLGLCLGSSWGNFSLLMSGIRFALELVHISWFAFTSGLMPRAVQLAAALHTSSLPISATLTSFWKYRTKGSFGCTRLFLRWACCFASF